jgi:secreted Zn-dependent insulinase-like peptidase
MCYLIEKDLVDKKNDNSCVITYYEIGQDVKDIYRPLTNSIMMNILKEPFFDDLRTK